MEVMRSQSSVFSTQSFWWSAIILENLGQQTKAFSPSSNQSRRHPIVRKKQKQKLNIIARPKYCALEQTEEIR